MKSFIVAYKLGSRYGRTYVEAHTKEQAGEIARIQTQGSYNTKSRFTIIQVLEEGEKNPYDEEAKKYLVKKP